MAHTNETESANGSNGKIIMNHLRDDDIARLDWAWIGAQLDAEGYAILPGLLDGAQTRSIAASIDTASVVLPEPFSAWRNAFYPHLAPIANRWNSALGIEKRFPATFDAFHTQNKKAGQTASLPSLNRLREHDYQALHQHAEGASVFLLQLVALLSEPGKDFTGGEFVMTEQRPRMQSRPMVLPLHQGDVAIITVALRPCKGGKGFYRVNIKHAISQVRSGERIGLELLFHDAR
jgi:hypothetical protein